jgi:hypothetical protein
MAYSGRAWGSTHLAIGVAALLLARSASASFIGVEDDWRIGTFCLGDPGGCIVFPAQTAVPSSLSRHST